MHIGSSDAEMLESNLDLGQIDPNTASIAAKINKTEG